MSLEERSQAGISLVENVKKKKKGRPDCEQDGGYCKAGGRRHP